MLDGSTGVTMLDDPVGLESASPTNRIDRYMAFDGGVLVDRRHPVRSIALPLFVEHATRIETAVAALATMLQGPGQLVYADDVNVRTLRKVIYETGIDGSGITTMTQRSLVVSLIALDPWFYGPAQSQSLAVATATAFDAAVTFSAVLPFDGGGTVGVVITGDAEVYPVITVTGPATTLTVGAGGITWATAVALLAGDTLVVDHRPGTRGPAKNGGVIDWSLLSEASRLWTLPVGTQSVISGATGSSGATSIVVAWEPRWLTP